MSDFEALGRDVAAAVDSEGEPAVATAVKTLWVWAGFDAGTNPNHLWAIEYEKTEDGFSVVAHLKDKDVWAPEPVVSPPTSAAELARSGADATDPVPAADVPVDQTPADAPVAPAPDPAPADTAPEVAPVADPPVAASSDESSAPSSDSTSDAAAS